MFKHLVGFDFGSNPELQINEIRAHKAGIAQMILSKLEGGRIKFNFVYRNFMRNRMMTTMSESILRHKNWG